MTASHKGVRNSRLNLTGSTMTSTDHRKENKSPVKLVRKSPHTKIRSNRLTLKQRIRGGVRWSIESLYLRLDDGSLDEMTQPELVALGFHLQQARAVVLRRKALRRRLDQSKLPPRPDKNRHLSDKKRHEV